MWPAPPNADTVHPASLFEPRPGVGLTSTANRVWVAVPAEGRVLGVDPSRNSVGVRMRCGKEPMYLASTEGAVFVTHPEGGALWKLDGEAGAVIGGPNRSLKHPRVITVAEGQVWVTELYRGEALAVDPRDARRSGRPVPVGSSALGIELGAVGCRDEVGGRHALGH